MNDSSSASRQRTVLGEQAGARCANTARHLFRAGPVPALRSVAVQYDGPGHPREKADYAMPVARGTGINPSRTLRAPGSTSISQHAR